MLPRDQIIAAVDIQKRSYRLLLWLNDAIERGLVASHSAQACTSKAEAAHHWIQEFYRILPEDVRPNTDQIRPFSNYLASYLTTPFDIDHDPGTQPVAPWGWVERIENLPHLQRRKPSTLDKKSAKQACITRVATLANEEGLVISDSSAATLAATHQRSAAYSAYGSSLLERIEGLECDPSVLVLWRMIAWKPEGSPIKGFTLRAEDIFDAEEELVAGMRRGGG